MDATNDPYEKPFYQTILLTTAPLDAVTSRILVDATASALEKVDVENRMVCLSPLASQISLPDWKPGTLQEHLGTMLPEQAVSHPLEDVTGGPDITVPELKAEMDRLLAEGADLVNQAIEWLADHKDLHRARQALMKAQETWTRAEMHNVRLYSIQFDLAKRKVDPDVDRG